MKIISGKHKNRIIPTSKDAHYRPTTAKFREALFSIITSGEFFNSKSIADAQVLDLLSQIWEKNPALAVRRFNI